MDMYPPEFDEPEICLVCGKDSSSREDECACPECPECASVGDPECYSLGHMEKGNRAFNLDDLARHLGANRGDEPSISKRLFKDTNCGISFGLIEHGVYIAGYAEGAGDAVCQPIEFNFPIDLDAFDEGVKRADQEGCDLFAEYHCSRCGGEIGYEESCEECDSGRDPS